MNRRTFNASIAALGAHAWFSPNPPAETPSRRRTALPSPDQRAWQDLEVGMFVHLAPNTWQDSETDLLTTPLSAIKLEHLDTDQWARTAVALGARYIVFVAKHQGGFCMWQTQTTSYSIRNTPWKDGHGDVLEEVAASCRKFGLKLGVYVCPRDDHFGAKTGGICATPELQQKYNALYREQLTEALSRYGSLVEVWFDGSTSTPVGDLLARYQPHAMIFQGPQASIRWVGNEDGFAPYPCWNGIDAPDAKTGTATALNCNADGDTWMPNEVDVSIRRPNWFWSTTNASKVMSEDTLLSVYYRSVGRGAQLLLNIPANREGLLSDPDVEVATHFGQEVKRRFATPLASIAGSGTSLSLPLSQPSLVDTIILQEDTVHGERIRAYTLEGRVNDRWQPLGGGSAVGHKRIHCVPATEVDAVRVIVTDQSAPPLFRALSVFHTGAPPPADWSASALIWAANLVGTWQQNEVSLDLSEFIQEAAQYRLRFVPLDGKVTGLRLSLSLHGVAEPAPLKYAKHSPNEVILDITGTKERVKLAGRIKGAASGQILLQKL